MLQNISLTGALSPGRLSGWYVMFYCLWRQMRLSITRQYSITATSSEIWRKGLFLTYFSHFLVTREKVTKIPSAHISLTYIHNVFCSPYWFFIFLFFFFPYQFRKTYEFIRYGFSLVWFLVLILVRAILEQSTNNKWWAKFKFKWRR